jgi:uncharacterized protein
MKLNAMAARVVGSLIEKQLTTPDQYPLTIKSLLAACNQASNRDPVVAYDETAVMATLDALKGQRFVRFVLPSHGRTAVRYRQVLGESLGLDARQCALLAVLLLRGPQTVGELRARTDRMTTFDGLDEVEHELQFLSAMAEPLTASLGRRPGQKEERWTCLLATSPDGPIALVPGDTGLPAPAGGATAADSRGLEDGPGSRSDDLRREIADLRSEVSELRSELDALRSSLGG